MFINSSELAARFKLLADLQRLRIVALCRSGEVSVGELVAVLGQSQPRVSQQLKLLCDAGMLSRFRDGKQVFYGMPRSQGPAERRLLALLPDDDEQFERDRERLRSLRGAALSEPLEDEGAQRAIARAVIEQTLLAPVGELLDIGCGRGRILKLLASRAHRAVGIDIDSAARNIARTELYLAGIDNCSLRQGDMYNLSFGDGSFDTIVLDDVLADAERPQAVLAEAGRVLRPKGRLLVLSGVTGDGRRAARDLAAWSREAGLRMAAPRLLPPTRPEWLLTVMTVAGDSAAAA